MNRSDESRTNQLLGYPPDARLLIVNADDFGMYGAINDAVLNAIKAGVVRSTSLMVPCPSASSAMYLLSKNPGIHFGVHLTVIRDIADYRYGPVAPREKVPSLVDNVTGSFYHLDQWTKFLAQAKLEEVEIEFRAQIDAVRAARLHPTHLDWHCLRNGGRTDIFELTRRLAKEYGLAVRVWETNPSEDIKGVPMVAHTWLDSFSLPTTEKSTRYAQMLHDLPAGLNEWAVHPGLGSAESKAIDPEGWNVRRTDYEFLISDEAREVIKQEGIVLLSYAPLQQVWNSGSPDAQPQDHGGEDDQHDPQDQRQARR